MHQFDLNRSADWNPSESRLGLEYENPTLPRHSCRRIATGGLRRGTQEEHKARLAVIRDLTTKYFDQILVHGDESFIRLEETLPLAQEFAYSTGNKIACNGGDLEVSVTYFEADNITWTPAAKRNKPCRPMPMPPQKMPA